MKKNLLLVATFSLLSLFSCNRDSNTDHGITTSKPIEAIVKDSRFISFETNEANAVLNIKDIKTVKELSGKGYLNSEELLKLSKALGFNNTQDYLNFYQNQQKLIKEINYDYNLNEKSNLDKVQKLIITENVFSNNLTASNKNNIAYLSPESCKRSYRNCMGAAASGALIAHVGCAAADLTIVAGAICHSAVLAAQYFAQDECGNQYENCK